MNASILKFGVIVLCIFHQIGFCFSGPCSNGQCECLNETMVCKQGEMPKYMPFEIRELFLEHFNLDLFNDSHRTNGSLIEKLDIDADLGESITSESLKQFSNLIYLGLHGEKLRTIDKTTLYGLTNLSTLNLSRNPLLHFRFISRVLNAENVPVLPSLTSLIVSGVQMSAVLSVHLDEYFFRSIAIGRHLKYLDISGLNIASINFSHFEPLCDSLDTLYIRNSKIGSTRNLQIVDECTSLRTIDASAVNVQALRFNFSFDIINASCLFLKFWFPTETVILNNINKGHDVRQGTYFLDMSMCPLHFRKVSIAGNKIKWMNMTVALHETTKHSLIELNVSYNGLEYLSPSVLKPSENIRSLDLSNNMLNVMQEIYTEEFGKLFWAQTKLQYLNLSHNSLSKIPTQTFSNNKYLKVLDISYNEINALDFSVKQFIKIEKLIASYNRIYTIENAVRLVLQKLFSRISHDSEGGNDVFNVYLEGNPFECVCGKANMRFIEWLHSTEVIGENETLTCFLEEDPVDVRGTGLAETRHFCRVKTIKNIAMISTPLVSAVVIICIIVGLLIKRRRKRKLMFRKVIAQIEMGTFRLPYLAFLSHCCEDTEIVMNKLYPELCEHLSRMTRSNESLVCIGDKHFRPGFALRDEVMRCVEESSVFVAIISRNYCRKFWCNMEIGEAHDQNKPIIMLMIEHVDKELMDDFLKKIFDRYAHATWVPDDNGGHIEPEWKLFCKSVILLAGKSTAHDKHDEIPAEIVI